jgi:hypothetical protein
MERKPKRRVYTDYTGHPLCRSHKPAIHPHCDGFTYRKLMSTSTCISSVAIALSSRVGRCETLHCTRLKHRDWDQWSVMPLRKSCEVLRGGVYPTVSPTTCRRCYFKLW